MYIFFETQEAKKIATIHILNTYRSKHAKLKHNIVITFYFFELMKSREKLCTYLLTYV